MTLLLAGILIVALAGVGAWLYHRNFEVDRFGELVPGQIYHSRQPIGSQYAILQRYGIKRVINLRPEDENPAVFAEEERMCAAAGVEFVNIPVDELLPTDEQIEQFLLAVCNRPGPVLFHCSIGRNRTIFMKAVYRVLYQDFTVSAALEEMREWEADLAGQKGAMCQEILSRLTRDRQQWLARIARGGASSAASRATEDPPG